MLFGSAFSHADSGQRYGNYWPSSDATVVAQADPRPAGPPRPPPSAMPRRAACRRAGAPSPPSAWMPSQSGSGLSVQIHDGKVQIDGVNDIVDSAIRVGAGRDPELGLAGRRARQAAEASRQGAGTTVKNRLSHLDASDLDQLGDELGKMGDDIGKQMDEFGKEMEKYGTRWKADKNFGKAAGQDTVARSTGTAGQGQ